LDVNPGLSLQRQLRWPLRLSSLKAKFQRKNIYVQPSHLFKIFSSMYVTVKIFFYFFILWLPWKMVCEWKMGSFGFNLFFSSHPGGEEQWTSHPPEEQKTRVRIPPRHKDFRENIPMLLCILDLICFVCVLEK
jgi:hypothetical protein